MSPKFARGLTCPRTIEDREPLGKLGVLSLSNGQVRDHQNKHRASGPPPHGTSSNTLTVFSVSVFPFRKVNVISFAVATSCS